MQDVRFADTQGSSCQASKRSIMVLENGPPADIQEFYFQAANVRKWTVPTCKGVDLLMLRNRVCRVRIVEIWAVLSRKEIDLLVHRNRVFRL